MEEVFKPVVGYEEYYEVSNLGNVYSIDRSIITKIGFPEKRKRRKMKFLYTRQGYLCIGLSKKNISKRVLVHRMVAMAFIPNPENKPQVNHKDLDKTNNKLDNLEWNTALENNKHAQLNRANYFGERHCKSKVNNEIVKEMRYVYRSQLYSMPELAFVYGLSTVSARQIIVGNTWKNVDYPVQSYREVDKKKLSTKLKERLAELNITQKQLANIIGHCRADVCRAVSGKSAGLNISIKLAAWLKINYKDLLVD
jgi:hypothetical protein